MSIFLLVPILLFIVSILDIICYIGEKTKSGKRAQKLSFLSSLFLTLLTLALYFLLILPIER